MKKIKGARRKPGVGGKIALAVVTCLNLALTLALTAARRQEVLRAVRNDEGTVQLLLEKTKEK